MDRLELAAEKDLFFDFCLWPYTPAKPAAGKFRSVNLLYRSFELAGIGSRAAMLVDAARSAVGEFYTVWGIKFSGEEFFWEWYFYDYRRRQRRRSISRVLAALETRIAVGDVRYSETVHYFMFSFDIDRRLLTGDRKLENLHMYIGNPGSSVSSGICYLLTNHLPRLENLYFFFDARTQQEDILAKTVCSACTDFSGIDVERVLIPELTDCRVIVVANKARNDAVYFSGIGVDQLVVFLERLNYPKRFRAFVADNRSRLDHLRFDVGFDYRAGKNGLEIIKSGLYGYF